MKNAVTGAGQVSGVARRAIFAAACAFMAAGAAWGATPGRATMPATRAATAPSQANKDAAKAEYAKAKDLYDAGKYADAQAENDQALVLDPANVDATLMKKVLDGKLAGTAGVAGLTGTLAVAGKPGLLTAGQISLIRLLQLSANETVRGHVDRAVLEDFWNEVVTKSPLGAENSKPAKDAFMNPNNFSAQAHRIKDADEAAYLDKVTITSDPVIMVAFRTTVHTYMLQNCATSECHGGDRAGNLRMIPSTGTISTEQVYTNFYIMEMYANKDGKMIDRDNADKSLFLQYGLPWSGATAKHPKVDVKKIPNMQDTRFQKMMDWVKVLSIPKPNYGIKFELAPAPATQAAH